MADLVPVLIGTAGMIEGEIFLLNREMELIIGRSRSCDISLRRCQAYLKAPAIQRDSDHDFNTVSRRHIRVVVSGSVAVINDLSTNGTFINGEPMRQPLRADLSLGACTIRMGTRETIQLLMIPADDIRLSGLRAVTPSPYRGEDGPLAN